MSIKLWRLFQKVSLNVWAMPHFGGVTQASKVTLEEVTGVRELQPSCLQSHLSALTWKSELIRNIRTSEKFFFFSDCEPTRRQMSVPEDSEDSITKNLPVLPVPFMRSQLCGPVFALLMRGIGRRPWPGWVLMTGIPRHTPVDSSDRVRTPGGRILWPNWVATPFQPCHCHQQGPGLCIATSDSLSQSRAWVPIASLGWVSGSCSAAGCSQQVSPVKPSTLGQLHNRDQAEPALCFLRGEKHFLDWGQKIHWKQPSCIFTWKKKKNTSKTMSFTRCSQIPGQNPPHCPASTAASFWLVLQQTKTCFVLFFLISQ